MVGRPREYFVYSLSPPPPPTNPQKKFINYCLQFLLGQLQYPGEMKNKTFAKPFFFWGGGGVTEVYYGRCANGEWVINVAQSLRSDLKQQYPSS